jgi:hypothetical protein
MNFAMLVFQGFRRQRHNWPQLCRIRVESESTDGYGGGILQRGDCRTYICSRRENADIARSFVRIHIIGGPECAPSQLGGKLRGGRAKSGNASRHVQVLLHVLLRDLRHC